eukprot:PhM_4_TR5309/c0_g1_i1/m.58046/K06997/yggS, PROSC; PLP dependent protein
MFHCSRSALSLFQQQSRRILLNSASTTLITTTPTKKMDPSADDIAANINSIKAAIQEKTTATSPVTLVAVSKTKPVEMLLAAYHNAGQRHFGENYVQEIVSKAPLMPSDVVWHFIGHLQSNKAKELLEGVPNLSVVETVDTVKLATVLNKQCAKVRSSDVPPLSVYIQVNTSGEESKSGTTPGPPTLQLASFIAKECPTLRLKGLMTIGMPDYTSRPENFACLLKCRDEVAAEIGLADVCQLELSMGMSGDYLAAVEMGSTSVRVGSAIFGARAKK